MDYNDKYLTEEGEYSLWLELQDCCPCLRLLGCYGIKKEYKDFLKYLLFVLLFTIQLFTRPPPTDEMGILKQELAELLGNQISFDAYPVHQCHMGPDWPQMAWTCYK